MRTAAGVCLGLLSLLSLWQETEMVCTRYLDSIHIVREVHTLGHLEIWGRRINEMREAEQLNFDAAEAAMAILGTLSHGLCDVGSPSMSTTTTTTSTTSTTTTMARFYGRMPRDALPVTPRPRTAARERRQASALFLLGTLGGMVLSTAIQNLLGGGGAQGGDRFQEFMQGTRRREELLKNDIEKMNRMILGVHQLAVEAIVMEELQALAYLERESWTQLTKETKLQGDSIVMKILKPTLDHWKRLRLYHEDAFPILNDPVPIPKEAYKISIEGRRSASCTDAALLITVVSMVPSKDCFWKLSSNEEYSVLSNTATGCLVGVPESEWIRLPDGTNWMMATPWESKRDVCDHNLLGQFNFKAYKNEVWLQTENAKQISICGETLSSQWIPKHQDNSTRIFRSVKLPCKGSILKNSTTLNKYTTKVILDNNNDTKVFNKLPFSSGFSTMNESDLKRPAEELESGGESWVLDEREQGWGLHEIAIMVTLLTLMTAGLAAGLGCWVWRRVSGSAMDVGHDYGKGFELEQDDTLRRAEEIAEKLGRVADGMEAMVEAMSELNEDEEEDSL